MGMGAVLGQGQTPGPYQRSRGDGHHGQVLQQLWPNCRALVPSEGWYEWVKDADDPKKKQPYFIHLKSRKPMFFGALAQVSVGLEPHEGEGFVIITAASDQGMVDIHDRKPLVLYRQRPIRLAGTRRAAAGNTFQIQ